MAESKPARTKEFLVVSLPDEAQPGATLRLLAVTNTENSAQKELDKLDAGILGRVAIVERKSLFVRRPAVESVELSDSILKKGA